MRIIDADSAARALPYDALIEALRAMFREGCTVPLRHHHGVEVPGKAEATLLLMPAWTPGGYIGIKMVTVFPSNGEKGLPAIMGQYLLLSGETGEVLAMIDGQTLTARRTAAASALAASYLAREDSEKMLMVGAGALAPQLIRAHLAVRPSLRRIAIWARDKTKSQALADKMAAETGRAVTAAGDLEEVARWADLISCATLSKQPLVHGAWLKPGAHLDLVGAFTPEMRESDDEAVRRASVFVDTREGALKEAGDIVLAVKSGALTPDAIRGDLYDLTRGTAKGRQSAQEITFFKSVGTALEDLAAAQLAYSRA
ncbi:bifunctional Delta(1)-pyrroline-2-carboxylate/Delta(1)-piperideine-2-carboxylate reductase [Oceanibaculum indicum]|uniref:Ornithine cyclodeaminase n=1 Tax=Oceanibaculum indicum P24 TaxID=1207063 RepID=K2KI28_9PROT|nr:ornithine cyclodeaminase family protein [Oceanibaculum indicum]EKE76935.1 ornithine cyclodeaminase [Oceanibaculum indicum P24]